MLLKFFKLKIIVTIYFLIFILRNLIGNYFLSIIQKIHTSLYLDCAKIHKIKLPLSNLIKKNYDKLVKNGFGNYDHSSIYKNYKKKLNTRGV